jgi:tetratricopeptide (TPR) repeat protein
MCQKFVGRAELGQNSCRGVLSVLRRVPDGGQSYRRAFEVSSSSGVSVVLKSGKLRVLSVVVLTALGAGACAHDQDGFETASFTGLEGTTLPDNVRMVREAQSQFSEGHYGLAADAYAKTVEADPLNPEAWLGLAAAYDQVGRFDQADKAYARVQELIGPTPSVLNNLGYSYLLRGNLDRSRATLTAAYRGDPGNPYILNNIEILNDRLATLGHAPMQLQ